MENKTSYELGKILWEYNCLNQTVEKADVILVLGSHDTRVAERGAYLLLQNYAPLIVFSGGFGRLTSEWTKSEAEVFAEAAYKKGVPKEKVLLEPFSTNTSENISMTKKLLDEKGIKADKMIVVTKPYMERRAYATFKKVLPNLEIVVTSPQISYEDYPATLTTKEKLISIMVGDTQRIIEYPKQGFAISQEIPEEVEKAYDELIKRGFISQLVKN